MGYDGTTGSLADRGLKTRDWAEDTCVGEETDEAAAGFAHYWEDTETWRAGASGLRWTSGNQHERNSAAKSLET